MNDRIISSLAEIDKGAKVYLYGAGDTGSRARRYLQHYRKDIEVLGFIDSFKEGEFEAMKVINIESISPQTIGNDLILVTSISWREIAAGLQAKGFENYQIYDCMIHVKDEVNLMVHDELKKTLALSVHYVHGSQVEGDIAEFGTMTGYTACILSAAVAMFDGLSKSPPKKVHFFDSFQGLPESQSTVDRSSPHYRTGLLNAGSHKHLGRDQLFERVRLVSGLGPERIAIHEGWFSDTLPVLPANTRFSLLHVDCDLYQSTIDVLDNCFSRGLVSEGGVIAFDDWDCNKASPRFGERKAWAEMVDKYSITFSDNGSYASVGHRYIIHSYKS